MRALVFVVPLLVPFVAACRVASVADASPRADAIQWTAESVRYVPGPATLPPGSEIAVLEGNPREPGLFTMRIRVPAGGRIAPHTHPRPERVTVISGAVSVGFGDRFDTTAMRTFHAGDYYVNPARVAHYVAFDETSVLQITGEGPWALHPVETAPTP